MVRAISLSCWIARVSIVKMKFCRFPVYIEALKYNSQLFLSATNTQNWYPVSSSVIRKMLSFHLGVRLGSHVLTLDPADSSPRLLNVGEAIPTARPVRTTTPRWHLWLASSVLDGFWAPTEPRKPSFVLGTEQDWRIAPCSTAEDDSDVQLVFAPVFCPESQRDWFALCG